MVAQDDTFIYGDALPDAPELAMRGNYQVGVRTLEWVNPDQVDVLNLASDPDARYDRPLTVEVWYPAIIPTDETALTDYQSYVGRSDLDTLQPYTFQGRALRDADPDTSNAAYPLVVVSHGYPGNRYMLSYLTENIASKGYVVVAIDHTDSTYDRVDNFFSTLYHRALDQNFAMSEVARLSAADGFLSGLVDVNNTAVIGYSMGGYGALNAVGAGYNNLLQSMFPTMETRLATSDTYHASLDDRIKAVVLFAPWGGDLTGIGVPGGSVWDAEAFANITIPSLWVAGSLDDVSGYEAIVGMFDNTVNSERYLLTYDNAMHNVAPNPPPDFVTDNDVYAHLNEPVWDERRINNINQHFVTAFLNHYLKGQDHGAYLKPEVESSNEGVVSEDTTENTYWSGFHPRTAVGMHLRAEPAR